MAVLKVQANEVLPSKRRVWFDLRDATDGISIETGEAGGQPQISSDGGSWTNTGIGTLNAIGQGVYYAELTQSAVASSGTYIKTRFKSANTAETPGDWVIVITDDPFMDSKSEIAAEVVAELTGNTGVVVLPTTSQQMSLADAISLSRVALHESETSDGFLDSEIRDAIRTLVSDFLIRTSINSTETTFTATIGEAKLDLSSVAGFRAERFLRAQIDFKDPLKRVDYESVSRDLDANADNSEPKKIAFDTPTVAYVSPRPDTAASIKIKYSLAANSLSSDTDTIQIPAEYLRPAIFWGVPALLRHAGQEGDEGNAAWRKYLDVVRKVTGFGQSDKGPLETNPQDYA